MSKRHHLYQIVEVTFWTGIMQGMDVFHGHSKRVMLNQYPVHDRRLYWPFAVCDFWKTGNEAPHYFSNHQNFLILNNEVKFSFPFIKRFLTFHCTSNVFFTQSCHSLQSFIILLYIQYQEMLLLSLQKCPWKWQPSVVMSLTDLGIYRFFSLSSLNIFRI